MQEYYQLYTGNNWGNNRCHSTEMCIDKGVVVKLFLLPYGGVHLIRLLSIAIFMFPLFLAAETIVVKTKAPHNPQVVFHYRVLIYALLRGIKKVRTWCAFAGLCLSASSASIFDWDLLADFQAYGNLSRLNFFLSWLLLCLFLVLLAVLIRGRINRKQLGIAVFLSCVCVIIPFALCKKQVPKIKDDIAITSPDAQLILYDDSWGIKAILAYCNEEYRIPLQPGFKKLSASKLILFGYASDYADAYPESEIIYVHPPEFFSPSPNTIKIFLPFHDPREFPGNVEYR